MMDTRPVNRLFVLLLLHWLEKTPISVSSFPLHSSSNICINTGTVLSPGTNETDKIVAQRAIRVARSFLPRSDPDSHTLSFRVH